MQISVEQWRSLVVELNRPPGLSPDGGNPLLELVGLHLILPAPEAVSVEAGHDRHHLLEASSSHGHSDSGG